MTSPDAITKLYSKDLSEIIYRISLEMNSILKEQNYISSNTFLNLVNSEVKAQVALIEIRDEAMAAQPKQRINNIIFENKGD